MEIEKEGIFIMMTKPSVAELLEKVDNRYLLVIATHYGNKAPAKLV